MKSTIAMLVFLIAILATFPLEGSAQDCWKEIGSRDCFDPPGITPCANPVGGQCNGKQTQYTGDSSPFAVTEEDPIFLSHELDWSDIVICSAEAPCVTDWENGQVVGCEPDLLNVDYVSTFDIGQVNWDLECL